MGLPQIIINFITAANTAITRSANGIVALILFDNTKTDTSYVINNEDNIVKSHWTANNLNYLNQVFKGNPAKVIIERVQSSDEPIDDALTRLKNKHWNYLAIPDLSQENKEQVANWIIAQRAVGKTYKTVLGSYEANHEGIINFVTEDVSVNSKIYTPQEFTARIAGLLAGTALNESATYHVIPEVTNITESLTPDEDIESGKLILINDGAEIKIGRAVNSLVTLTGTKSNNLKNIKVVEGIDIIRDDIRESFKNNYIGKVNNFDNKVNFTNAVDAYFKELVSAGVLYDKGINQSYIDLDAQKSYLREQGKDVENMTITEIQDANTGSHLFIGANVSFAEAVEDLNFNIYMD